MPTNAKKIVYREKEFGIYALWKSLPPHVRGMTKKELMALGYTDPVVAKIIKIKSQSEFARAFGIKDLGTLTDWNAKLETRQTSPLPVNDSLKKEKAEIREKILLPLLQSLERKIENQKNQLLEIKRKNVVLRKQLRKTRSRTIKNIHAETQSEVHKPTDIEQTKKHIEHGQGFFEKLKKVFGR